ncbi:hypothetical protein [Mucilaginibacter psychrotolerans]|uniref:Uncharacterized protein n=1 Tax=Mucilaginibacter psychrotolerans TaxID=1524096 RepID=A0A4Y8RY81_9SPHI|nr:hypothetical protein [Mucilaginibacter psychrotolerans]TFF29726.1 hypothetical protein E2R66_27995 [Mucilaginibacter psychrotolerans]
MKHNFSVFGIYSLNILKLLAIPKRLILLTVLTEHFTEFDKNFLGQLSEKYVVFFFDRSGKRVSYDYNLVKTTIGV